MASPLPTCAQAEREYLGDWDSSCDFFGWFCHAATGFQNLERHCLGETESSAESLVPVSYSLDRNNSLGGQKRKKQAHVQLSGDAESDRQADEDGLARGGIPYQ